MTELEAKRDFLLALDKTRSAIAEYKYVHVFNNDKFCKGIIKSIQSLFNPAEHCFVISGGVPADIIPIPDLPSVYTFPNALFLRNSDNISKFIFHGMYVPGVAHILYNNRDILAKSYWLPWGRDIYEGYLDDDEMIYAKSNMAGVAANAHCRKIYAQKYGGKPVFFPYDISYESIPYETIIAAKSPDKDYTQILVNNCAHQTTFEAFDYLKKFRDENIRVSTILSYGDYPNTSEIVRKGKNIFGSSFTPVEKLLPPDQYIKFLARNDIFIINQRRPQGMTTFFTMMLLGKKVFMRSDLAGYLLEDGYHVSATEKIKDMSFNDFKQADGIEANRALAAKRFDRDHVRQFWASIFSHVPGEPSRARSENE